MNPEFTVAGIKAYCPDCNAPSSFEYRNPNTSSEFGEVIVNKSHVVAGATFERTFFKLYRCAVCSRPGVAKLHVNNRLEDAVFEWFWPTASKQLQLPPNTPIGVMAEFREAERCMTVNAWRAAAALLRSALEKVLKANGFDEKDLYRKIEAAGADGVITSARRQRAQDLVRTLGNDVLHDDWREITQLEAESAHHYVARIIEDLYDERPTVEKILTAKNRKYEPAA